VRVALSERRRDTQTYISDITRDALPFDVGSQQVHHYQPTLTHAAADKRQRAAACRHRRRQMGATQDHGLVSCLACSRSAPTRPASCRLRVVPSRDGRCTRSVLGTTASFTHGMYIDERIASPQRAPCPCTLTMHPLLRTPSAVKDTVVARVSAPQGPATLHAGDFAQDAKQGPLLLHQWLHHASPQREHCY